MAKTLYDLALDYLNQGMPDITQAPRNTSPGTTFPGTTTNPTDYFNLPTTNILPNPGDDGGITNNIISTPQQGNTAEQQRLIDEGIGLQIEPGSPVFAPGEMPLTQTDIDQFNSGLTANQGGGVGGSYDEEFGINTPINFTVPNSTYDEAGLDIGDGSTYDEAGVIPPTQTYYDGNATLQDAGAGQGGMQLAEIGLGGEADFTPPSTYDAAGLDIVENNPYGTNPNTGNPYTQPRTIADQNAVLGQTNETNNVLNNAKNLGIAGLDNVIEIGGKSIDVGKSLAGAALSSMVGIPGIGLALNALPERDQRQNELDNLYDVENGTIQSGLMKGYNPVSGNPLDPNFGLQDAYQDRIDTIEETIERKSDADKNYDKTELQNRINQLEIDKAKEADILNLYEGDINPEGTGDASIAEKIAENNRLGIPSDIGVEGEDEGRFSDKVSYDGQKIPQSLVDGFNQSIYSGGEGDISDYSLDELSRFSPVNQNRGSMFDLQDEPVSTPSGENPFGLQDEPVSTPSGENPFGLPDEPVNTPSGENPFGLPDEPVSTPSGENPFGRPDEPVSTPSGVNPFADIDTGVGEFDTAPGTGINSIAGVDSIPSTPQSDFTVPDSTYDEEIFNNPETGVELDPVNPNERASIIDQAKEAGIGNLEQHFKNNIKLEKAAQVGLIDKELYNELGGYDVTQNITGGSKILGGSLNAIVGPGRNVAQAIKGEQDFAGIPATTIDNTQGALGIISQDKKNIHNAIINGDPYTDEGIAAIENQIEMSQYEDPIMDMVNQNILADDTINKMTDDVDLDFFDTAPTITNRTGGDSGDNSPAPSAPQKATETASYSNQDSYESAAYDAPAPAYRPATVQRPGSGGGGGDSGGGGGGGGGGGTHCCTAANERGDMTLLEVKKLRVWHRKQSKIWQRGYDVWGRVMADNLVSKYKWSSDRVRDFYNHKIYGKRTIGSTFADFCIYPMSMIIGCILTVMPPILGYQKQKNKHG